MNIKAETIANLLSHLSRLERPYRKTAGRVCTGIRLIEEKTARFETGFYGVSKEQFVWAKSYVGNIVIGVLTVSNTSLCFTNFTQYVVYKHSNRKIISLS